MALPARLERTVPADSDNPSAGAAQIRALKGFLEDLFGVLDTQSYTAKAMDVGLAGQVTVAQQRLLFQDGSATIPAFAFAGATSTGLAYDGATTAIAVLRNGVKVGHLGIPTRTDMGGTGLDTSAVTGIPELRAGIWYFPENHVNVKTFGASPSASATANTAAFQAAINSLSGDAYGIGQLVTANLFTGNMPVIEIPVGTYHINDNLTFSYFTKFRSKGAIIVQDNPAKKIFSSDIIYMNEFQGITFVGGTTQIDAQNGPTGQVGQEGALVKIRDCEFQLATTVAVRLAASGAGGGYQSMIRDSRFLSCAKSLYTMADWTSLRDCWIGVYPQAGLLHPMANDTAQIENYSNLKIDDAVFIPGDSAFSGAGYTNRWIDNYASVHADNCRFGGENAGIPIIYNFTDALPNPAVYPYVPAGSVTVNRSLICCGAFARADRGVVVLKSGLPNQIVLDDNTYATDGVFLRTNLLTGAVSFATYMAGAEAGQPYLGIKIKNNTAYGTGLTDSAASTALLAPYVESNILGTPANGGNISQLPQLGTLAIYGQSYAQTGISPAAPNDTISIVDTGIPCLDLGVVQPTPAQSYLVTVRGYHTALLHGAAGEVVTGVLSVTYISGQTPTLAWSAIRAGAALTVTPTVNSGQIRLSIGGYVAGSAGLQQTVQMLRIM